MLTTDIRHINIKTDIH